MALKFESSTDCRKLRRSGARYASTLSDVRVDVKAVPGPKGADNMSLAAFVCVVEPQGEGNHFVLIPSQRA